MVYSILCASVSHLVAKKVHIYIYIYRKPETNLKIQP